MVGTTNNEGSLTSTVQANTKLDLVLYFIMEMVCSARYDWSWLNAAPTQVWWKRRDQGATGWLVLKKWVRNIWNIKIQ